DIDISYLRVSIGSSDLNDHTFSYDDLPPGKTDPTLKHFNLAEDKKDVIPALKEILAIDPSIKILGSPWSAPVWMKTNHNIQGGMLERKYYPVYAKYFVKYIRAMKKNGITIDAVTIQNEPFNNGNTPSMQIFAKQELDFVKNYLGPAFQAQGIRTKIIIYDHNCDAPEYPISILTDTEARKYIDGSAFHLYAGNISGLTKVHHAFPRKNVYLTEMMAVSFGKTFPLALPESKIVIGAMRNWSKNVILWNLTANSHFEPHTNNGGCSMCQGAITIDKNQVSRNIAYYMIAHASKFVPPHSVRIGTNTNDSLSNVAFRTPTGKIVLLVANVSDSTQKFNIIYKGEEVQPELGKGEVATFVW
ncbi:MAG: glucosylceramidase, partial [Chitinophagaceae bacterium]